MHFTGKTWREFFKDPENFERKVALLSQLPWILARAGKDAVNEKPFHKHEDFNRFKRVITKIPAPNGSGKEWKVTFYIGAVNGSKDDFILYHFTVEE